MRLQIAKQYPDLHLGPGYAWNNGNAGDSQWSLGLTLELPILDQNQGPIAEAKARRELAAAQFTALQAKVIGEIDRAVAGYSVADGQLQTGDALLAAEQKQRESAAAQFQAGAADLLDSVSAQMELRQRPARASRRAGEIPDRARRIGRRAATARRRNGSRRDRHRADEPRPAPVSNFRRKGKTAMNSSVKFLLTGGIVALCAGAGIFMLVKSHGTASASDEEAATPTVVTVQLGALKRVTLHRYVQGYGTIEAAPATADQPAAGAQLAAPSAGVVARVNVIAGQQVKQGDVLVELNSGTVTADYAEQEAARQEKLYAQQNTSLKNLQDAEAQLALLRVAAPVSGTVTRLAVRPGEAVDVNTVVAEVVDLSRLAVDAEIPAAEAADLITGDEVQISGTGFQPVNGQEARSTAAALSFVSPAVDPKTGAVLTRALLPADSGLRPGQFVRLKIVTAVHTDCLAAPAESVVTDENGKSVIALVNGDEAAQTPVTAGLREDGWVEVAGTGLKEGASVVTVGAYGLPEKTKVNVVKPNGDEQK